MTSVDLIEQGFRPTVGLPCWDAKRVHGSMFMMEFGEPSLQVHERRTRRSVFVVGQWRLSVELCGWKIMQEGKQLAYCESSQLEMDRAIAYLDGQSLMDVPSVGGKGFWQFSFDFGGTLTILPYEDPESDEEQ